ncbi:hypothetical protein QYE76_060614 [Lolium multiflorum]|uniref:Uncharacterized protein n=1 Tax=Lolium multiflorum TaxID=4521 RepID=A0AAD8RZF1_LOLMU|nr:hypothetical protein QYE76_060614 [Lolium multiflorum]
MAGEGGRGQVGGKGKEPLSESKEPLDTTLGLLQEKKDEHAEGVVNKGFDIVDGEESVQSGIAPPPAPTVKREAEESSGGSAPKLPRLAGENTKRKGSTGGFVADSVEAPEPPLDLGFSLRAAWSALDRGITADAVLQGLRHNRQPVPESSAPKSPLSPGAIACLICEVNEATTSLKPKGSHRCLCAHCLKFTAEAPDLHLCKVCKEEPSKKFSKST